MFNYAKFSPGQMPAAATNLMYKPYPGNPEAVPLVKPAKSRRKLLNCHSIFLALVLPPLVFTVMIWLMSGDIRRKHGTATWFVASLLLVFSLVFGGYSILEKKKQTATPSWSLYLALSLLAATVLGFLLGNYTYTSHMQQAFDIGELNSYVNVDPTQVRGEQLMDAGIIEFTPGTYVDINKSMAFKEKVMYCVAPITAGNSALATYDLWVVGTNCCNGDEQKFNCLGVSDNFGVIRLMSDKARPYYRMAVQQAEATYGVRALHPLFFTWVPDVPTEELHWRLWSRNFVLTAMGAFFVVNLFCVGVASFAFSKLVV